jgi:hypothetical protein
LKENPTFSGAIGRCPESTEEKRDGSRLAGGDERSELGLYAARPPCEALRTMALEREGKHLTEGRSGETRLAYCLEFAFCTTDV